MSEQEEGTHHLSPNGRKRELRETCSCMQNLGWPFTAEFHGFHIFILFLIIPTYQPQIQSNKTATFIQKKKKKKPLQPLRVCVPALRSEILPRYLPSAPLRQLRQLCTRLRAAHWRTLGNEGQLGLTGKDAGWHNSAIPSSACQKALSFHPFSFHLPVWPGQTYPEFKWAGGPQSLKLLIHLLGKAQPK